MRLRYYLRGLGIGIIVTAIIMNASFSRKDEMSDEEIKARAAELGMIENTVLAPPNQTPTPTAGAAADAPGRTGIVTPAESGQETPPAVSPSASSTPTAIPEPTAEPTPTATPVPTATPAPTATPVPTATPTPTATPVPTAIPTPTATPTPARDTVTITINRGEGSDTVSRKAAQAGLVEDAADFDRYLCENGYDKKLVTGNHVIPLGSSYEEIARLLTGLGN